MNNYERTPVEFYCNLTVDVSLCRAEIPVVYSSSPSATDLILKNVVEQPSYIADSMITVFQLIYRLY